MKLRNPFRPKSKEPAPIVHPMEEQPAIWNGPKPEHVIVPAFISGGTQYFMFVDTFGIPSGRAFHALTYYEEAQMKVEREFLLAYLEAVEKELNSGQLVKVARHTGILRKRLEYIFEPDILYKLASVMFFDASENPYTYDFAYAAKKMELWKKEQVEDFFYGTPLASFLPSFKESGTDLESYIAGIRLETLLQLESFAETFSNSPPSAATQDYLNSAMAARSNWLKSRPTQSTNTTFS